MMEPQTGRAEAIETERDALSIRRIGLGRLWRHRDRSARLRPMLHLDAPGGDASAGATEHGLNLSVRLDRPGVAVVTLSGLLVRQHAEDLDGSLAPVFAGDHPLFVIDLGGVTRLDPTTLATITRRAEAVRERGAVVTIVPPGAHPDQAA